MGTMHREARIGLDVEQLVGMLERSMRKRGMDQSTLAEETGLLKSTVSRLLREKRQPSVDAFLSLCDWLGVSPEHFAERRRPGRNGRA